MEPWQAVRIKSRQSTLESIPGTLRLALARAAGPHEQYTAFLNGHSMVSFRRVEIICRDPGIVFEPFDALYFWNVEQNTSADNTLFGHVDRTFFGHMRTHFSRIKPVIHLTSMKHVAQRIEMSIGQAMGGNGEIITDVR